MKDKVLGALRNAGSPLKAGEIADAVGADKSEVDKAIKELKKEDAIYSPKRCYYAVNE